MPTPAPPVSAPRQTSVPECTFPPIPPEPPGPPPCRTTALCPPSHPATTPNLVRIGSETAEIWRVKCSGKHISARPARTSWSTALSHHCPVSRQPPDHHPKFGVNRCRDAGAIACQSCNIPESTFPPVPLEPPDPPPCRPTAFCPPNHPITTRRSCYTYCAADKHTD